MKVTWSTNEVICVDEELCNLEDAPHIDWQQIEHLNLSFNKIVDVQQVHQAVGLKVLNIMHNHIKSLSGIEKLVHLRTLKCGYNKIHALHGVFDQLVHLEELWLNSNRIELIELTSLRPLVHLQTLILEPNPCCKEPMIKMFLVNILPSLRRIDATIITDEYRKRAQTFIQSQEGRALEKLVQPSKIPKQVPLIKSKPQATKSSESEENLQDNNSLKSKQDSKPNPVPLKPKLKKPAFDIESFPIQEYIPAATTPAIDFSSLSICDAISSLPVFGSLSKSTKSSKVSSLKCKPPIDTPLKQENKPEYDDEDDILDMEAYKPTTNTPIKQTTPKTPPIQNEFTVKYTGSTVTGVHIRCDGSAIARWPNGAIAATIDHEGNEKYRAFATYKDGSLALNFDKDGVGFVNYPNGKTMLSTTSTGDGLYMSADNGSILAQWNILRGELDEWRNINQKLSDHLGINVSISNTTSLRIDLFLVCNNMRIRLTNGYNLAMNNSDDCNHLFGKPSAPPKKKQPAKLPHSTLVSEIRAAAAKLN